MVKTINLKNKKERRLIGKRELIISVLAIILATAGIRASDSFLGSDSGDELCPVDMVFIPSSSGGFCIDKFEASPGKNCPYEKTDNQEDGKRNMASPDCKPVSVKGNQPWVFISQSQAREACARAGKRLPTNKEWFSASLGTPDKNSAWGVNDCHVAENWMQRPGQTGSGSTCESSFGVLDMVGNVWEWTDQTINDGKLNGETLPDEGYIYEVDENGMAMETGPRNAGDFNNDYFWIKNTGVRGIARGGFYSSKDQAGIYSAYLVSAPSYAGVGVGFRCVK